MTITDIVIEPNNPDNINTERRVAKVHIVIDRCLRINDVMILKNDTRMFVEFPCNQGDSAHPYIIPLNRRIRAYIERTIIGKYLEN